MSERPNHLPRPAVTVPKNIPPLSSARRRPVSLFTGADQASFTTISQTQDFPFVIEAKTDGLLLADWTTGRRAEFEDLATRYGAVLLRGFVVRDVDDFHRCVENICGEALEYRFRASPRTEVGANIYTATDYPADQFIFPHHEHAYSPVCPRYLIFYCEKPAEEGGETPIGDNRQITRRIDPAVKERFLERGILYVRNYGAGFGLPWPVVFQTSDRAEVERYCDNLGIEWEWKSEDRLCTQQTGPAMIRHLQTGEELWFNHGTFFHVTTLPAALGDALRAEFAEDDLPTQTFYGDGSPIEPETLEHLRSLYLEAMRAFAWRRNDVLLVDNCLTVHGRNPYRGSRRVLVAMAQKFKPREHAILVGAEA
jgi:alpha-ketoglutarate-dependent taurine dioxygenase